MPRILELKAANEPGTIWVRLEVPGPQGELSILSREEIERIKRQAHQNIIDVVIDLTNNLEAHLNLMYRKDD